ncbi:MAG: hypothetical protein Fur006_52740 [Coleofasciculaceae cyanobacterium]
MFFIEEPIFSPDTCVHPETSKASGGVGWLDVTRHDSGVWVVVPHLQERLSQEEANAAQQVLLDALFAEHEISKYICWYYTPPIRALDSMG